MAPKSSWQVIVDRKLCDPSAQVGRGAFWEFVQLAWSHMPGDPNAASFVPTRYMKFLCDVVFQPFILDRGPGFSEWTLLNIPPSHAKSALANVMLPAWTWGPAGMPTHAFGHLSYNQELVTRDSTKCRGLIQSDWYQERWPVEVTDDRIGWFGNTAGGFRVCNTIRGGITGKHFNSIILDDPQNPSKLSIEEASEAAAESEMAAEVIDVVIPSRILDSRSRNMVIMQRLGLNDASQHLIEHYSEKLTHYVLPLKYDPSTAEEYDWRLLDGELLSPERFSHDFWDGKFQGMRPHTISAQYQQVPVASGSGYFDEGDFKRWSSREDLPQDGLLCLSLDAAQKGRATTKQQKAAVKRSYWVLQAWLKSGKDRYLLEQVRFKEDFHIALEICRTFAERVVAEKKEGWVVSRFLIEEQAAGPQAISVWKRDGAPGGFVIHPYNPGTKSKEERAEACLPVIKGGHVWMPQSEPELVARLAAFPRGRHDDEVDAMTQMLLYWAANSVPVSDQLKGLDGWRA